MRPWGNITRSLAGRPVDRLSPGCQGGYSQNHASLGASLGALASGECP